MRVVLLVDAQVLPRAQLARELRKLPALEVVDAGALHEAVQLLDCMHVDLVVARQSLPDGRAEALAPQLEREGRTIPAVVISDQTPLPTGALPPSIDLLAGPVAPAVVRAQVAARLGAPRPEPVRAVHIPPRGVPLPRLVPPMPPPSARADASASIPAVAVPDEADFDRLYEQGIDAMLARRYGDALAVLERASRIRSTSTLQANLQRLRALGVGG